MSFKTLGLVALVSLLGVSCARENMAKDDVIQVRLKSGGRCIHEFRDQVGDYFSGRMKRSDVLDFFACTEKAIDDFERLTASENGGSTYSPQALRRFFYKHFLDGQAFDDEILNSLMEIKRVFLSGSPTAVTREDFQRLKEFVGEIKLMALEMHPHVLVLFEGDASPSDKQVQNALEALDRAVTRLCKWLDQRQEPYQIAAFEKFILSMKSWVESGGEKSPILENFVKGLHLIGPSKRLLVGGDEGVIEGAEWSSLVSSLGRIFRVSVGFRQTFRSDLNSGLVRSLIPEMVLNVSEIFEQALVRRPAEGLPFEEWDHFFRGLENSGLFPTWVTAKALTEAFHWLVIRPLKGGEGAKFLTFEQARNLANWSHRWSDLLRSVDDPTFPKSPDWPQFEKVLKASVPLEWDREGRLIHPAHGLKSWSPETERRMVWPFMILDWLRESYVGASDKLTEDDVTLAVHEILPLIQNFGWLNSTKLSIGTRLLREADLFTLASNGDFHLDMGEATRYLVFVASAFRTSEIWLEEADRDCSGREAECVRLRPTIATSDVLTAMPLLRSQVLADPPDVFTNYMRRAEETVLGGAVSGPMGVKDILQVMMLFQYVETFLREYDQDHSQTIELSESLEAYKRYGPTLAKLLSRNGLPPDQILAFFTFMMKYGDTPFAMFGGQVYFLNWKMHRNDWSFQADRVTLMSILNQLSKL